MSPTNPERRPANEFAKHEPGFIDKMRQLLPHIEFEETAEILEARTAVLKVLEMKEANPELIRSVWVEYGVVCEEAVDQLSSGETSGFRAQLQIAVLVHKALLLREIGDMRRYCEELIDADKYAFNMRFDDISEAINKELDKIISELP